MNMREMDVNSNCGEEFFVMKLNALFWLNGKGGSESMNSWANTTFKKIFPKYSSS